MSLFLVNTRHNQDWRFYYRLPEQASAAPAYLDIKMGEQRELPSPYGGLTEPAIQAILAANERYGWVESGTGLPKGKYVYVLWSRKPVTEKYILSAIEHNQMVVKMQTAGRLDNVARGVADAIDDGLHRSQLPDRLRRFEATVQEEGENASADDAVSIEMTTPRREQAEHRRRNSRRLS